MKPVEFFDVNACFGIPMLAPSRPCETADALLEEMDFSGVAEALVFHTAMRDDSPLWGNPLVLETTAGRPRLHPAWAILPPQTGELAECGGVGVWEYGGAAGRPDLPHSHTPPLPHSASIVSQFLAAMKASGVRVLRAFPTPHRYFLNGTTFGPLFEEMIARRIPLVVPGDWAMIEGILRDFPNLRLIANQLSNHSQDRYFRPLIERYPNFYVDTTHYQADGGIAAFCRKYGAQRMLFGSGFPDLPMGAAMLSVLHADLPEGDRAAVAGGNLRRLLEEVKL